MGEAADSLLILSGMIEDIADYKLAKNKFEKTQQQELDIIDRQDDARRDQTNISASLDILKERRLQVNDQINKKMNDLSEYDLNVFDIIKLPEWAQTEGGQAVTGAINQEYISELSRMGEAGNYIGENIANQEEALKYNEFVLNQLNLLEGQVNNMKAKTFALTVDKGEDAILSIEDYMGKDLGNTEIFESLENLEGKIPGLARHGLMGPDDVVGMPYHMEAVDIEGTEFIDESKFAKDIYRQTAEKAIYKEGEMAEALNLQHQYEEKLREIEHAGWKRDVEVKKSETANMKFVQKPLLDVDGKPLRNDEGNIIYDEGRNMSAIDIADNATDDWLIYPELKYEAPTGIKTSDVYKSAKKEFTGSYKWSLGNVNKITVDDTDIVGDPFSNVFFEIAIPADASFETKEEIEYTTNQIEFQLYQQFFGALDVADSKRGVPIIDVLPAEWTLFGRDEDTALEDEWEDLLETRQLYSEYDVNGNLIKRGMVDFILGRNKDGFKNKNRYSPGRGGVDVDAETFMDLGLPASQGPNKNWAKIYNIALALDHGNRVRENYAGYINQNNPLIPLGSSGSLAQEDQTGFFDRRGDKIENIGKDKNQTELGTQSGTTGESISFATFVKDITDARSAKKYAGPVRASKLSQVVKAYRANPNPQTKAAVEALYNEYVK